MAAFIIWCGCFALLFLLGLYCFFSKKQVSFWANAKPFSVTDVRGSNQACGFLWIGYSLVGILTGLPLLTPESTALVLLSTLGVVADTLMLILIYVLVIEKKYRK